jgi:hypothetical protein
VSDPVAPLVEVRDIELETGATLDANAAEWMQRKLMLAYRDLESILNRKIAPTTVTGEPQLMPATLPPWWDTAYGPFESAVHLNWSPVISIEAITVDGIAVTDPTSWVQHSWGIEFYALPGTSIPAALVFDYTAGYTDETVIGACKHAIIQRCSREFGQRQRRLVQAALGATGITEMAVEGTTLRFGDEYATARQGQVLGFLEEEIEVVHRYKRRFIR